MLYPLPKDDNERRASFFALLATIKAGLSADTEAYTATQTDSALGALFLDLKEECGIILTEAALTDDIKPTFNTGICSASYLRWLKLIAADMTRRYAKENHTLYQDLCKLWADNRLTKNHMVLIGEWPWSSDDGLGPLMDHVVFKNKIPWPASKKLIMALQRIYEAYKFDTLAIRPCCDGFGTVSFERTIDDVLCDTMTDENNVSHPTNGVDQQDGHGDNDQSQGGYTGYIN
jgi:hypothetical protein